MSEGGAPADYLAIDGDGHVIEGDELFQHYLPAEFRTRAPGALLNAQQLRRFFFEGSEQPPFPAPISIRKPMAAEDRIKVLDKERIWAALLYPSGALAALYAGRSRSRPRGRRGLSRMDRRLLCALPRPAAVRGALGARRYRRARALAEKAVARGARAIAVRPNPRRAAHGTSPRSIRSMRRSPNWACRWCFTTRRAIRTPRRATAMAWTIPPAMPSAMSSRTASSRCSRP